MQTLGLSDSTPRTENRVKSLFWPSIDTQADVDYITTQGFWICLVAAALTFVTGAVQGQPAGAAFDSLYFVLAGAGVRQRSRFAAVNAFLIYLLSQAVSLRLTGRAFGVIGIFIIALLLANIRALWLSVRWARLAPQEEIPRLGQTWTDKIADRFPAWVWPKGRYVFYLLAAIEYLGLTLMLFAPRSLLSD